MRVLERRTGLAAFAQGRATSVAGSAGVHPGRVGKVVADRKPGARRRELPRFVPAALQRWQALVFPAVVRRPGVPGPVHMGRRRTVAGFAGDVDFAESGLVGIAGRVIALAQIGRVALSALQRPVLVEAGPVQGVLGDRPSGSGRGGTSAGRPRSSGSRIPGNRQRLVAPAGEGNQILLQRVEAEGVGDLVVRKLAVGAVGADHELVATLEEGGLDAVLPELDVGEVTEHARGVGLLHRQLVMGTRPGLEFRLVAGLAGLGADVGGGRAGRRRLGRGNGHRRRRRYWWWRRRPGGKEHHAGDRQCQEQPGDKQPVAAWPSIDNHLPTPQLSAGGLASRSSGHVAWRISGGVQPTSAKVVRVTPSKLRVTLPGNPWAACLTPGYRKCLRLGAAQ
jgi:hypothetical protein